MANFELLLKTIEIVSWISSSASCEEQQKRVANYLSGMGIEYNRFGNTLIGWTEECEENKNICINLKYHDSNKAIKPLIASGRLNGIHLVESLHLGATLSAISLMKNVYTTRNIYVSVSEKGKGVESFYDFEKEILAPTNIEIENNLKKIDVSISTENGLEYVSTADIGRYVDYLFANLLELVNR